MLLSFFDDNTIIKNIDNSENLKPVLIEYLKNKGYSGYGIDESEEIPEKNQQQLEENQPFFPQDDDDVNPPIFFQDDDDVKIID